MTLAKPMLRLTRARPWESRLVTFPRSYILSIVREVDENVCQGDDREEGYIIIVRAVVTTDFMTASAYHFDWDFRKQLSLSLESGHMQS